MVDIMLIPNISEKPDLLFLQEHGHTKRVYRCISKPLIKEATCSVKPIEVRFICFTSPEVERTYLKVGEELAIVIFTSCTRIEEPGEVRFGVYQMRMSGGKSVSTFPKGGEGAGVIEDIHVEAIFETIVSHKTKYVVVDIAVEVNLSRQLH